MSTSYYNEKTATCNPNRYIVYRPVKYRRFSAEGNVVGRSILVDGSMCLRLLKIKLRLLLLLLLSGIQPKWMSMSGLLIWLYRLHRDSFSIFPHPPLSPLKWIPGCASGAECRVLPPGNSVAVEDYLWRQRRRYRMILRAACSCFLVSKLLLQ